MSDRIDELYRNATPDVDSGEIQTNGHLIQYILFGYEIDSLSNLFPIFITYDGGYELSEIRRSIIKNIDQNPDFTVCAPGIYTPPPVHNEDTDCLIRFIKITPHTEPTLIDSVSEAQVIRVTNQFTSELEDGGHPYLNSGSTDEGEFAKFFLDIGRGHSVQLPFPTRRPSTNEEDEQLQTILPCYIITSEEANWRGQELPEKELITLRWSYPLLE